MREICFRARRKSDNVMVYGSLDIMYEGTPFINSWHSKLIEPENNYYEPHQDCDEVLPDTVEQFTTYRDRNKKRIFEGDTLRVDGFEGSVPFACALIAFSSMERNDTYDKVIFKDGCFGIVSDDKRQFGEFIPLHQFYEVAEIMTEQELKEQRNGN